MFQIKNFLADRPFQKRTVVIPDGSAFVMTLYYREMQRSWCITTLEYGDFTLNGLMLCNSPNMLYQWKNLIPFGLACYSTGDREPSLLEDLGTEASKLYVLDEDEVAEYAETLRTNG